jgi:hypothetical protein
MLTSSTMASSKPVLQSAVAFYFGTIYFGVRLSRIVVELRYRLLAAMFPFSVYLDVVAFEPQSM